jgi:hypothetical protein
MKPSITINSRPEHEAQVPTVLRKIADEYVDAMWSADTAAEMSLCKQTARQLRAIADLSDQGKADADTGLLFIAAGRRLLDSLKAARMDAEHESRASRRVPKPSDTMAAKRAFARERSN